MSGHCATEIFSIEVRNEFLLYRHRLPVFLETPCLTIFFHRTAARRQTFSTAYLRHMALPLAID